MTSEVLVLNRNFLAIHFAPWERAVTLLYRGLAMVVDEEYRTYDFSDWLDLSRTMALEPSGFIHTPTVRIAIPEVIALRYFGGVPKREIPFTRRNIYQHYGNRCCYCGKRFPSDRLNLEHVIPRSRGGRSDWENVVTACIPCNLRKGDRLPAEAGMHLLRRPARPRWRQGYSLLIRSPMPMRRSWQRFVDNAYWDSQLET